MKLAISCLLTAMLCGLIIPVQAQAGAQFVPYVNAEKGFSLSFPVGWGIKDGMASPAVQATAPLPVDKTFPGSAFVQVEDLADGVSLDAYEKEVLQYFRALYGTSFTVVKESDTTVGGLPAKGIVYRAKLGRRPVMQCVSAMLVREKQGFCITCECPPPIFDQYKTLFKTIIDSFKLQTPTGVKKSMKQGFDITFPADWEINDGYMGARAYIGMRPLKDGAGYRENVVVGFQEMDKEMPLTDYVLQFSKSMQVVFEDYKLVQTGDAVLNTAQAKYLILTYRLGDELIKAQVFILKNGTKIYQIICNAAPNIFDRYQPIFEQIANTFVMTEK